MSLPRDEVKCLAWYYNRLRVLLGNVERIKCPKCPELLEQHIDAYPHPKGLPVGSEGELLWLYVHCNGCKTDYAIWKLLRGITKESF